MAEPPPPPPPARPLSGDAPSSDPATLPAAPAPAAAPFPLGVSTRQKKKGVRRTWPPARPPVPIRCVSEMTPRICLQADALKAQQHEENTRRAAEALERRRQAQLSADQHAEEQAEREAQRQVNISPHL